MKSQYVFNSKQPMIMAMLFATAIILCVLGGKTQIGANALLVGIIILLFVCGCAVILIKSTVAANAEEEKITIEHYILNRKIYEYDILLSEISQAGCETKSKNTTSATIYMHTLCIKLKNGRRKCFTASFFNEDGTAFDENSDEYKTAVEYHMLTRICNYINERLGKNE